MLVRDIMKYKKQLWWFFALNISSSCAPTFVSLESIILEIVHIIRHSIYVIHRFFVVEAHVGGIFNFEHVSYRIGSEQQQNKVIHFSCAESKRTVDKKNLHFYGECLRFDEFVVSFSHLKFFCVWHSSFNPFVYHKTSIAHSLTNDIQFVVPYANDLAFHMHSHIHHSRNILGSLLLKHFDICWIIIGNDSWQSKNAFRLCLAFDENFMCDACVPNISWLCPLSLSHSLSEQQQTPTKTCSRERHPLSSSCHLMWKKEFCYFNTV